MTFKAIALELDTPVKQLERDSTLAYLEKHLHSVEADLLTLAIKYDAGSVKNFLQLVRQGKIVDSPEAIDDFFHLDYLQNRRTIINKLIRQL